VNARVLIKNLSALDDGPVSVSGWVETVRDQKTVQFVVLRDESGAVQLVNPRNTDADGVVIADEPAKISGLSQGSFVTVTGQLKHDERVKLGGIEIKLASLEVVTHAIPETPIAADSSLDKRMDWRFLDLRHPKQNLIFRIQTTFEHALRTYWVNNDFIELHTPKRWPARASPAPAVRVEYFDTKAYLAQSRSSSQMAQSSASARSSRWGRRSGRPVLHQPARHRVHQRRLRDQLDRQPRRRQRSCTKAAVAVTAVKAKHGEEVQRCSASRSPCRARRSCASCWLRP
jgi:aspartyl-tRNA synthetase